MRVTRVVAGLAILGLAAAGAFLAVAWRPEIAPVPPPAPASFDPALVRRGADLALIGDCRTCHTARNGAAFAGGLPLPTPFGTLYSTNITPDPGTGIGRWSETAFARALREGVDREGRHLYPAFPYDHYGATDDDDVRALYAFVMTRPAVAATAPPNGLPFPLNVRLTLAGWKLLFLRRKDLAPDPAKDEAWHRGRTLVEGLGHCGACHSPRNLLGAEIASRAYEGGEAEGWRAYALGGASRAPVPWDEAALTQYLREGFHPLHGVARGPMAPVVENLATVPPEDVAAMARYLASLGAGSGTATPSLAPPPGGRGVGAHPPPRGGGLGAAPPAPRPHPRSRAGAAIGRRAGGGVGSRHGPLRGGLRRLSRGRPAAALRRDLARALDRGRRREPAQPGQRHPGRPAGAGRDGPADHAGLRRRYDRCPGGEPRGWLAPALRRRVPLARSRFNHPRGPRRPPPPGAPGGGPDPMTPT